MSSGIVNVANYNNLVTLDVRDANVCVIVQCNNNTDTPNDGSASSMTFVYANSTYITNSVDESNYWSGSLPCANYPTYRHLPAPMSFANSKVTIYPSNSGGYMKWWAFKQ